jgi:hypothetical protein
MILLVELTIYCISSWNVSLKPLSCWMPLICKCQKEAALEDVADGKTATLTGWAQLW